MLADLDGHRPEEIEFCLTEAQKEMFKDVLVLCEGAKSADEPIKVLHDKFNALFPDNEVVDRKYDDFEIHAIREEYCIKQENYVPKRKEELETVLAQIKTMKKNAEEAYTSALSRSAIWLQESRMASRISACLLQRLLVLPSMVIISSMLGWMTSSSFARFRKSLIGTELDCGARKMSISRL